MQAIKEKVMLELLGSVEYGTLALCEEGRPYSLPINFVHNKGTIYFHGRKHGRKINAIMSNAAVSFSVVKNYSIIPSYFSSDEGLACPATQFFSSALLDGSAQIIEQKEEKILALSLLMQKLQPEGGYRPFKESAYDKMLAATGVFKMKIEHSDVKLKFGQKLSDERFEMVIKNLEIRADESDMATLEMMREMRKI